MIIVWCKLLDLIIHLSFSQQLKIKIQKQNDRVNKLQSDI